jgi:hypothetical protein
MNQEQIHRNTLSGAPRWVHGFTWGVFGAFTLALLVLYYFYGNTDVWFLWFEDSPKSRGSFAETIRPSIFRTRANTWSNLGYILFGLYIVAYAWWDARRETSEQDPYAVRQPALLGLYGVSSIVVGIGSGLMHASLMGFGHKMDVLGMFFTFVALIALQWARWLPFVPFTNRRWPAWPIAGFVAVAVTALLMVYRREIAGDEAILGWLFLTVLLGVGVDVFRRGISQQYRWALLAFVSLAVGGYIQRSDIAREFSPPDVWWQGHAIWHGFTAVMYASMAIYYRSEAPRPRVKRAPEPATV